MNHATHWICSNSHREISAYNYHKDNVDAGRTRELICCMCMPHLNCGDDVARVQTEEQLKRVKYEQGQITEVMKKRYPELFGIGQQELNREKE